MTQAELPPEDWDQRLQRLGGHFLQSRVWAEVQNALNRPPSFGEGEGWMWSAALRQSRGLRYLLCSYGPSAASSAGFQKALDDLCSEAKKVGADFVRVEPTNWITPSQLRSNGAIEIGEFQPSHTQIVDLSQDEDALRAALNSGHRNPINTANARGLTISRSQNKDDFVEFLKMLDETAERSKIRFFPREFYQTLYDELIPKNAMSLYIAKHNGQPVAAALFYDWGETRMYAHAGAHQELNRKVNASVVLVWRAMIDAKNEGKRKFDLWGVAPTDDPSHPWAGITRFKKGFGGEQVDYLGTWDIPLKAGKYRLYGLYRKLKGRQ